MLRVVPGFYKAIIAAPATAEMKAKAMPPTGALRLKREESAPAVDGVMVAAVPVPVPVPVLEGEVLVRETETAVLKDLLAVEEVTTVELPLTDEAVVEDAVSVEVVEAPIENVPVEA